MAFLRTTTGSGLPSRVIVARITNPALTVSLGRRTLFTTPRLLAQVDPFRPSDAQMRDHIQTVIEPRSPPLSVRLPPEKPVDPANPYQNGPSAIEKAVHMFFFTEIIRGGFVLHRHHLMIWSDSHRYSAFLRNVDRFGAILPSSIYNHVSV